MPKRTIGHANLAGEVFETVLASDKKGLELRFATQFAQLLQSEGISISVVDSGRNEADTVDIVLEGPEGRIDLQVGEAFDEVRHRRQAIQQKILASLWDAPTVALCGGMSFNFVDLNGSDGYVNLKIHLDEIITRLRAGLEEAFERAGDAITKISFPEPVVQVDIPTLRPIYLHFGRYAKVADMLPLRYVWSMGAVFSSGPTPQHFMKVLKDKILNKYGKQNIELWLLIFSVSHSFNLEEEAAALELIDQSLTMPYKRVYVLFGNTVVQIFPSQDNSSRLDVSPPRALLRGTDFLATEHDSRWIYVSRAS